MTLLGPIAVALLAAAPPPSPALAKLAFDEGLSVRVGSLRDEAMLHDCAAVPDCALGCARRLEALANGADAERAPACPGAKGVAPGAEPAASVARVRRRLAEAGASAARLAPPDRDRLLCGLGRLGLGPAQPDACVRAEARLLPRTLRDAPAAADPSAGPFLFGLCSELEGCSGACARELALLASLGWPQVQIPELARALGGSPCPELGRVVGEGPSAGAEARAVAWTRARVAGFAGRACAIVPDAERATLACDLQRLGVTPLPAACRAPAGCVRR